MDITSGMPRPRPVDIMLGDMRPAPFPAEVARRRAETVAKEVLPYVVAKEVLPNMIAKEVLPNMVAKEVFLTQ